MSNKNKSTRPKFGLEFKQDAGRLVIEKGYTQQEAADHLGVSLSAIRRWVRAEWPPVKNDPPSKKTLRLLLAGHLPLVLSVSSSGLWPNPTFHIWRF